jgi:hypothetical protein
LIDSLQTTPDSTIYLLFHDARAERAFLRNHLMIDVSAFKQGIESAHGPGVVIIDTQDVFKAWSGYKVLKCGLRHCCETLAIVPRFLHNAGMQKKLVSGGGSKTAGNSSVLMMIHPSILLSPIGNDAYYTLAIFEAMMMRDERTISSASSGASATVSRIVDTTDSIPSRQ